MISHIHHISVHISGEDNWKLSQQGVAQMEAIVRRRLTSYLATMGGQVRSVHWDDRTGQMVCDYKLPPASSHIVIDIKLAAQHAASLGENA